MRLLRVKQGLLTTAVFLLGLAVTAQNRQLGTWRAHMPHNTSLGAFNAGSKVYSVTAQSAFSVDKNTGEVRVYDKATGLSDVNIKTAAYDPENHVLAIAYVNSNLDLIFNETEVYNLPDFKNENTSGSVGINSLSFYNGNCYVASDMGISVINLSSKEIKNTYIIGSSGQQIRVYDVAINGNTIVAATQEGVKYAALNAANLQDFNAWQLYTYAQGLPAKKAGWVEPFNGKLYATISGTVTDTLYELNAGQWTKLLADSGFQFSNLAATQQYLYFCEWTSGGVAGGKNGRIDAAGNFSYTSARLRPANWFETDGIIWTADNWNGLFKNNQGNDENIIPNSPGSASVYKMDITNGILWVAPGGVDDSYGNTYNGSGFFRYENGTWYSKNQYTDPILSNMVDYLCVAAVPARNEVYFGSFWAGVTRYNYADQSIFNFDKDNSILEGAQGDSVRTRISAMTTDANGNLWISCGGATRPVKLLKSNGQWQDYQVPYSGILMKRMMFDRNNQLWAPIRSGSHGILVWSYNGTIDDPSDDVSRILGAGAGNGALPDAVVNSVVEDKDGNIWVGTLQGIAVFYCPGSVLTGNGCDADQIKVERDGYIGYLFGTESIRALAVDAANRKWVGTTNGIWLITPDGKEELLRFTVDNSPLPTNQITDIVIDDQTGEVFIGTTGGIVSYQGDAMAECADCDEALVYPNPVRPNYTGPIAIKGLTEDAYVKITDVSGTLIYQGKANGSQMVWDGNNYNGQRAKSGVYLVFSSTDLGKEKRVAKIVLAN